MAQIRYLSKLILAYLNKFKGIIFIGIVLGVLFFLILRYLIPILIKGDTRKIGLVGKYQIDNLPEEILLKISKGLTKVDENNVVVPELSDSWETTDKGKTWIFHLSDNIKWQDGKKLESFEIKYDYSDVSTEYPDTKTIVFKLKENAFSPFPSTLTKPVFKKGLLGVGEWKVENISFKGGYISNIRIKNKDRTIIYKFYPTNDRLKLAYKLGEVDEISYLLDIDPFKYWNTVNISSKINKNQVVLIFLNTTDETLSDKSIRQALAYSIDKDNLGERALGPISPDSWAYNPQMKQYNFDSQKAKELIDEYKKNSKKDVSLKLVSSPYLLNVAEKISKNWNDIGINSSIQVTSIIPPDFQAFLTILDIPKDPDQYPLWHSTRTSTNISNYTNFRIDKLLEEGRTVLDFEERRKIYLDFQRFILEDLPAIFLYHPNYYTVIRK